MEHAPKDLVSAKVIAEARALPLYKRGNRLFVAIADPTDLKALDSIQFASGLSCEAVVVEADKLTQVIETLGQSGEQSLGDLEDSDLDNIDLDDTDPSRDEDAGEDPSNDQPIVRFVNKILLDAIRLGASDIHFEPYEKTYRIRYRTDGVLNRG